MIVTVDAQQSIDGLKLDDEVIAHGVQGDGEVRGYRCSLPRLKSGRARLWLKDRESKICPLL